MKKIILSLMAGMVLFTSCDLLNNDPYDSFTKDNYFTSETNVEMYCNYFYNEWKGYGNNSSLGDFYFKWLNDNQANTGIEPWKFEQPEAVDGTWDACYEEIRRANILLEKIGNVDMPAASMDYYTSLARLYRAWQHFCLVRRFGDCYWVDKALTTEDATILYGKRHPRNEVMDKVLEDLNYAVEHIGEKNASSRTAYNVHVVNAIKSQICLFEGTYVKYHQNEGQNNERSIQYLEEAKNAAQAIFDSNEFDLTPGIEGYRANYNSLDLAGNKEMIMYKRYVKNIFAHATISYNASSTTTKGLTKDAFNAYLLKNGKIAKPGQDHGTLGADGKPSIENLLAERDPRLAQQIDGYLCYTGNDRVRYVDIPGQENGMPNTSTTGYGCLKFDNPNIPCDDRKTIGQNETDAPIFWLAEILLNHAEACAELGGSNEGLAIQSLNRLRARAEMHLYEEQSDPLNIANPEYGIVAVSNLIWEIRRERRVELMFDKDDRYWSLIRWHELGRLDTEEYKDQTLGAWLDDSWPMDAELKKNRVNGYISLYREYKRIYNKKHYLAPIPTDQIVLNPEIGQNPGW